VLAYREIRKTKASVNFLGILKRHRSVGNWYEVFTLPYSCLEVTLDDIPRTIAIAV